MSNFVPPRPRKVGARRTYAIVASSYNPEYVQGLVNYAACAFDAHSPNSKVILHQVPGAFEIPVVAQELCRDPHILAVLALGVIIRGETAHAELIGRAVTETLLRISVDHSKPIINEVLLLDNEEQARARCLEEELNRGAEAAYTAIEMVEMFEAFKTAAAKNISHG